METTSNIQRSTKGVDWGKAILAGAVATALMTVVMVVGQNTSPVRLAHLRQTNGGFTT